MITTILFDFGGVIIESPFIAFARYEHDNGLPAGFLRTVNATNPNGNAWARLERSDITVEQFDSIFAAESETLGHRVPGSEVLELLHGEVRPLMIRALADLRRLGYRIACLTNNVAIEHDVRDDIAHAMSLFDAVYESSRLGVRKPEIGFYEAVLDDLGIEGDEAVFLDDLGINLKPARSLGLHTIKVTSEAQALDELAELLGEPGLTAPDRSHTAG